MSGGGGGQKKCGLTELLVFLGALVCGTLCTIMSKNMMALRGTGITGEDERFEKPIFQTFGMFLGMLFALLMHFAVLALKIPFPGYDHGDAAAATPASVYGAASPGEKTRLVQKQGGRPAQAAVPASMYFLLAVPACFDLVATALCMMGLKYVPVSIYQLLRGSGKSMGEGVVVGEGHQVTSFNFSTCGGDVAVASVEFLSPIFVLERYATSVLTLRLAPRSIRLPTNGLAGIIFVAIMKQYFLGDKLYSFQWVGIGFNLLSVFMVGSVAVLGGGGDEDVEGGSSVGLGVFLVILGAFVQALQYVFEEKVLSMDVPAPPLLLIGMEGFWGTLLCLTVAYPLVYYLPGTDHGSYEDPFNTWHMVMNSTTIQIAFAVYFFSIFFYNFLAVLVTFLLNSVWHAILDNFRPITVWIADLVLFYCLSPSLGEEWTTLSWLQVGGMAVLLYGTAVYNAPNAGSVSLRGEWYSLCLDYSAEYDVLQAEAAAEVEEDGFKGRMLEKRTMSSFRGELAANLR